MSQAHRIERVVVSLQAAALDDAHWVSAAALLNEATGSRGHALGFGEGRSHRDAALFFLRFCWGEERREDYERTYLTNYWHRDERVLRWIRLPESTLVPTPSLYTERERQVSAVYNELLRDRRAQNGLNIRMDGPAGSHVVWVLADPIDSTGWGSEQIGMVEQLRPHIRQFMGVRQALVDARAVGASLSGLLDNARTCVIQLDRNGRIAAANDPARDMLRRRDALFAPDGFLRATTPAADAELQRLVASATPPLRRQAVGGSMTIRGSSPSTSLLVHVHPVEAEVRDGRTHRVAALVLAADARTPVQVDPDVVALALGLTSAESQVAAMLAAGHTVRDIAALTNRKERTVHSHLHQIYRKQDITRQAELVRRVLALQMFPGGR